MDETWNLFRFRIVKVFMKKSNSALACMVTHYFTKPLNTLLDTIWTNLNIRNVIDLFLSDGYKNHAYLNGTQKMFILKMEKLITASINLDVR